MNSLPYYGARLKIGSSNSITSKFAIATIASRNEARFRSAPRICPDCQVSTRSRPTGLNTARRHYGVSKRPLSISTRRFQDGHSPITPPTTTASIEEEAKPVDDASLPSRTEERRGQMSRRMSHMMDVMLTRASIAGQHINEYTGTDYTGIEALKKRIIDQEEKVKGRHKLVDSARETHHDTHEKQDSSQKEIVSLLERKSSWSPPDLERYMSLVRSEHANDQAVQAANEGLAAAERDLEEARSLLERLERKQYHEEQIWSDTIRRNSTWVTFGLMGVNILLLLAQIGIFEPYRRRKIVREVKLALDEKAIAPPEVERQIDQVVEPIGVSIEAIERPNTALSLDVIDSASEDAGQTPLAAGEVLPEEAVQLSDYSQPSQSSAVPEAAAAHPSTWSGTWEAYRESFQDLFSERIVELKKVDVTTTALQGAATGVAAMGLLFVLLRPR